MYDCEIIYFLFLFEVSCFVFKCYCFIFEILENFFMYVINKCVFLWKLKDFSNNIFIDNVSSRLIIVFV